MKVALCLIALLAVPIANAADRTFTCNAVDDLGRTSILEVNIETGAVRMKDAESTSANWRILYDVGTYCTHKAAALWTCTRNFIHNFDDPQKLHPALADSIRCLNASKKPEVQLNGEVEINRFGDGTGFFACGTLSKFHLNLDKCKPSIE
jgi:hypothetical protein